MSWLDALRGTLHWLNLAGLSPDQGRSAPASAHLRVTLVHALVGVSWILASDEILALANPDAAQVTALQTYKGLAYVLATTLMLYLLLETVVRGLASSQRSLLDKQRELDALIANLPGGVYRRGSSDQAAYAFLSPGAVALLGSAGSSASGLTFPTFVHEADRPLVERRIQSALRARQPFEVRYRVVGRDGVTRWIRDSGRGVEAPDGALQIEGYVCDVTELGQMEERLQHAERLASVGCMASGIAHDFNNVLFAIDAGCELLDSGPLTDTEKELVGSMRCASDSARGLVASLLTFARDRGRKTCELELDAVVGRAQPLLHKLAPHGVRLRLALDAGHGAVEGDATQLEQVLLNLVTNAVQAVQGRGEIGIATRLSNLERQDARCPELPPGRYLVLEVEDNGVGIDAAVLPHIFEPFFTTKGEAGTGLGLATVRKIVEDMGGATVVWSERGRGTRFTVYLPALPATPRSLTVPPPAPRASVASRAAATQ